ncbi:pyruvate kinase [uncultured Thiodictyon sp.]|uniref:pyruvate kinase n=1 Tax=uncultured Thiodictyon sp. TaxID=1846217 RepID=UPI0025D91D2F|nr:pyruvate kinase [uncultured Thiodictyon sp.]
MTRRTKIVATLGPATDSPAVMDAIIAAGVDVVRLNLSHDTHERHRERVRLVRERALTTGQELAILIDLQGPKIRIGRFHDGAVELANGAAFAIDSDCLLADGDGTQVGTTYPELAQDVRPGDVLLLDDGAIELLVESVTGGRIACTVVSGGTLSNAKGINKKGGGLSAPALTDKDKADIRFAAEIGADYLAVSFVRSAEDVNLARELLRAAGGRGGIVAKIERAEALNCVDEIIQASDVIMVARGDLGVEIGDAKLPAVQKRLIKRARDLNRAAITATQMMQSMIDHAIPTRAEVFDVANAVLDGTDAVMLSAESSVGRFPVQVVEALDRVCVEAELHVTRSGHRLDSVFGRVDEAIAMAAMYTANHLGVKAIAALTETGATVKWMSRISSGIPIYAMSGSTETRRRARIFRGVYPLSFDEACQDVNLVNQAVIEELKRHGTVCDGDLVIITKGDRCGVEGQTNIMKIMRVGEHQVVERD